MSRKDNEQFGCLILAFLAFVVLSPFIAFFAAIIELANQALTWALTPFGLCVCVPGGLVIVVVAVAINAEARKRRERADRLEDARRRVEHDRQLEVDRQNLGLSCRRCGTLALPILDSQNRYRCDRCGRQFVGARHGLIEYRSMLRYLYPGQPESSREEKPKGRDLHDDLL